MSRASSDLLTLAWRFLPAFRVVAESGSLTRAAQHLGVTAPALSRSLQKLEAAVGRQLFDRAGKRIVLNPHGDALLQTLRDVDTRLGGALDAVSNRDVVGFVRLASVGQLGRVFLLPAVTALAKRQPELKLSLEHVEPEVAFERLKGGTLDAYLTLNAAVGEPLTARTLADLELAVFAGPPHPLFVKGNVTAADLPRYGFVAQRRMSLLRSPWPTTAKRTVSLETDSHAVALEACLHGSHLMLMERVVGAPYVREGKLREVEVEFTMHADLVLCQHARRAHDRAQMQIVSSIAEAVRRVLEAAR